jgi:prevent-host-death family protein
VAGHGAKAIKQERPCTSLDARSENFIQALVRKIDKFHQWTYAMTYIKGVDMPTITATEARKSLYRLLDEVSESHEPIQITGKRGNAILISEDDWRAVQETLYFHTIPGMKESIVEGLNTPVDKCDEELDW